MSIQNFPEVFLPEAGPLPDLFVYDYKMSQDVIRSKVNLSLNMFSFLQTGQKQVHFAQSSVGVNEKQSLLIKNSNCLVTELLDDAPIYFCKLFFFSQKCIRDFLLKYTIVSPTRVSESPYFIIENDEYISLFVRSLSSLMSIQPGQPQALLATKFEEIMLYLWTKYEDRFLVYLYSLIDKETDPSFRKQVETHVLSNLKLEEVAFLCNMSLSSFKRHFIAEFDETPGKWFQRKRLYRAKELLQTGSLKPSDIYLDLGYQNLSNFSIAFKNEFGVSPTRLAQGSESHF